MLWSPLFIRALQDWEMEEANALFQMLYSLKVRGNGVDRMHWTLTKRGTFDVKSFYSALAKCERAVPFLGRAYGGLKCLIG